MQTSVQLPNNLDIWTEFSTGSVPTSPAGQIDRRENLSRKEFLHEYVLKNQPVILKDAAKHWKAVSKWTPEFFKEQYGDKKVPVFERKRAVTLKDMVLMRDYIDEITASTYQNRAKYLFS